MNHEEPFDEEEQSDEEELIDQQRSPLDNVALVSLRSKTEEIDMQANGIVCLQSIAFESPAKLRPGASVPSSRRLQDWPAEVSRLKNFCMDLRKPRETGLDMLTLILRYSPRSWFQTEVFRSGLKSIAKEFWQSFLGYTANVSSEVELMSWFFAFNYHAKRRGLRCALEFTSTERPLSKQFQLKFTPKTPKRKRSAMFSDGEQDELKKIGCVQKLHKQRRL